MKPRNFTDSNFLVEKPKKTENMKKALKNNLP